MLKQGHSLYFRLGFGLIFLFVVLATLGLLARPAHALTQPQIKGLTVSPLRTELDIAPGTAQDETLTVTNTTDAPMVVDFSAEAFSTIDPNYDYAFDSTSELASWVAFKPAALTLESGKSATSTFTISVPLGAEPGGRYISLFASNDPQQTSDGITARQSVASLVYITVTGDVSRIGELQSLYSPLIVAGNTTWTMDIHNRGSTHFHSRYSLDIKPLFGDATLSSSSDNALILPNTIRLVDGALPVPQFPGIYRAVYTIGLGDSPSAHITRLIIYMPPIATATLMLILVGLGTFIILRVKSGRRSK